MSANAASTFFVDGSRAPRPWSLPRRFVAWLIAASASMAWAPGFAALLSSSGAEGGAIAASILVAGALVASFAGAFIALPSRHAELVGAGSGALAALASAALAPGSLLGAMALAPLAAASTLLGRHLALRLPKELDAVLTRRRALALAWAGLALIALAQGARLSAHMADRDIGFFLTTSHPFWYGHECLGAYLHGAELALRGEENLYHSCHYPGLDSEAEPKSALVGMALDDPYQYPPPFLLLPRLALWLTEDAGLIRGLWFGLQATLFGAVAAGLALFVGGREGRVALWLLPAVAVSFPALHNFQFGQFHLATIALAVGAMLCFRRGHGALGGAALAFAILAKLFPAVLLVLLALERRFRALAWTAAFAGLFSLLTLALFGSAPFTAFLDYQLPRLGSGEAFAFDAAWPELAELLVIDNQGVYGLALKLGLDKSAAGALGRVFAALVFLAAAWLGLERRGEGAGGETLWEAASWLALLGLGSLASPGAWGDYVPVTAVWLLSLLALRVWRAPKGALVLALVFVFEGLLLGTMPFGDYAPLVPMRVLSALGALIMLALFAGTLIAARSRAHARRDGGDRFARRLKTTEPLAQALSSQAREARAGGR